MSDKQVPAAGNAPRNNGRRGMTPGKPPPALPADSTDELTPNQKRLYEAWTDFDQRLMQVLAVLEEDEYLIISRKGTNRFVQFAGQGAHGMRVETVSNFYLPERQQFSEAQHDRLLQFGWNPPCNLPDQFGHEPVGSPNYFLDLPQPVDFRYVALLAINTLLGPIGAEHPLDLEYRSLAATGESIRWPTLKLRRAPN